MPAPERIETSRLVMTVPVPDDAQEIFDRYANDPLVTLYLGWPTHQRVADTEGFVTFSTGQWKREGMGPYLIRSRETGVLLGSTGLGLAKSEEGEGPRALTGYVLARDAWGYGYATESLIAMIEVARSVGIASLSALCHPEHSASIRVLEKCDFARDFRWTRKVLFPNLPTGAPETTWCFTRPCKP
jgi:ribosomal-protein-alanine N-acetyltransferase